MKKLVFATMSAALFSTAAYAGDTDSQSFTISANILPECSVEAPKDVNFGNLAINEDPGESALEGTFGRRTQTQNIWVSCNYGADMAIAAESMTTDEANDGPDADDFTNVIPVRMGLEASDGTSFRKMFFDSLTKEGDSKTNTDAFHDRAKLSVVVNQEDLKGKRPLAGAYSSTATVNLGAI
ncbi:Csu type fimbrial protein [Qipengyuania sp. 483]